MLRSGRARSASAQAGSAASADAGRTEQGERSPGDDAAGGAANVDECESNGVSCWVCLEQGSAKHALVRGCACRGHSGWAHFDCLVKTAQSNRLCWLQCPTCRQRWTGKLYLQMAREWSRVVARAGPERPGARELVDMNMSVALRLVGRLAESVRIGREVVRSCRSQFGDVHEITLSVVTDLANTYTELGDPGSALPLYESALKGNRLRYGNDHRVTLAALGNLAGAHRDLGGIKEALPLYEEDLAASRRLLRADDPDLLTSIHNMGTLLQELGRLDSALLLLQEALEGCERVLGRQHPDTLQTLGMIGRVQCKKSNFDAARSLYDEVAAGFTQVYDEAHVLVSYYGLCKGCAENQEVPKSFEEFKADQETMYERRMKRPRKVSYH